MAETSNGLSGVALGALTVGALLVYAGFRGVSPLQALRDVTSGSPPAISSHNAGLTPLETSQLGPTPSSLGPVSSFGAAVVQDAEARANEKYSQSPIKRSAVGFSDCSSYAAKSFYDAGATSVKPYWTTMSFRGSSQFKVIDTAQAQRGDIIITPLMTATNAHMAIVTAPGQAIGQQNPSSNVQKGSFEQIMSGKPSFIAMRYVGKLPAKYQ